MADWLNLGQVLKVNARTYPHTIAFKDKERAFTYPETNSRVNKLAYSLLNLGLSKGDKVAVLLENSIEIVEIYLAAAKTGLVVVPINFRLVGQEIEYIVNNSDAKALFVHDDFVQNVEPIRSKLGNIRNENYILVGDKSLHGYTNYDTLLSNESEEEPEVEVNPQDTWLILYTSGTTGVPKGVVRSHESYVAFYLINAVDFGFTKNDVCLNIMPLCHVNSTFFTFTFTYLGGSVYIHPARRFDPTEILEIIEQEKITFISLVPTHYSMILSVPKEIKNKYDVSSIKKLLCSSAPAHSETKKGIMKFFPDVELYEGYGSTEAGIVTILKPEEQYKKLGSIGRESLGIDIVKILDENGEEATVGEVGELYSRGPMMFHEYYKMPDKTKESFIDGYFTARDMARKDEDGYYYIVDRKDNLIITGGENVFPSEVEEVIFQHPKVFDVAVIGVPDKKWGEAVKAIIILKDGEEASENEIIEFCKDRIAGFKKPKSVDFIGQDDMPRTTTGKIIHRELRERYAMGLKS